MAFKDIWKDVVEGDFIDPKHINDVAHGVIDNESRTDELEREISGENGWNEQAKAAAVKAENAAKEAVSAKEAAEKASPVIVQTTGESEAAVMSQKAVTEEFEVVKKDIDVIENVGFNVTKENSFVDDIANFKKVDNAWWDANWWDAIEKEVANTSWEYYKKNVVQGEMYHIVAHLASTAGIYLYNASGKRVATLPDKNISGIVDIEITIPEGAASIIINNNKVQNTAVIEKYSPDNAAKIITPKDDYLYGKRLVACGDSITDAYDLEANNGSYIKSYAEIAANRHGMIFKKNAVSGSTMAYNADGSQPVSTSAFSNTRYTNLPEFDYLTIWFGWNDASYSQLGTIDDTDNTTFYGAYKIVLEHLITNNPTKKIGLVVPYGNSSVEPFAQAVREISQMYGVPCLDLRDYNKCSAFWEKTSGNAALVARRNALTFDTTHPNKEGHEFLSTMYDNFIKSL